MTEEARHADPVHGPAFDGAPASPGSGGPSALGGRARGRGVLVTLLSRRGGAVRPGSHRRRARLDHVRSLHLVGLPPDAPARSGVRRLRGHGVRGHHGATHDDRPTPGRSLLAAGPHRSGGDGVRRVPGRGAAGDPARVRRRQRVRRHRLPRGPLLPGQSPAGCRSDGATPGGAGPSPRPRQPDALSPAPHVLHPAVVGRRDGPATAEHPVPPALERRPAGDGVARVGGRASRPPDGPREPGDGVQQHPGRPGGDRGGPRQRVDQPDRGHRPGRRSGPVRHDPGQRSPGALRASIRLAPEGAPRSSRMAASTA
jgi:hypothetical protein